MSITVYDKDLNPQTIETLPSTGRKAATASLPTVAATEDKAVMDAQAASLVTVAALSKAEDAAHTTGDPGIQALAVRKDTATALAGTDGDYTPLITDANGRLHVLFGNSTLAVTGTFYQATQPVSGTFWQATQPVSLATMPTLAAGTALIGKVGIDQTTPGTTNGVVIKDSSGAAIDYTTPAISEGAVAHDAAIGTTKPTAVGGRARTSNPTAVVQDDNTHAMFDKLGKQVVVPALRDLKNVQATTITSSTSETTIVTAAASTFHDLYGLTIANSSATDTEVAIKDSTAGTTRMTVAVKAGQTAGFMVDAGSAIPQATVNNNWTATCADSVAAILITALYVKNI